MEALTSKSFSRDAFLQQLDRFYVAIENAAATFDDLSDKQGFLNTVYEKFFQGFSVQSADTRNCVHTAGYSRLYGKVSARNITKRVWKITGWSHIHILDPFVGTGNLRYELPRISFASNFSKLVQAGQKLAQIHVDYESQEEYELYWIETSIRSTGAYRKCNSV